MRSNYKKLGNYIEACDCLNTSGAITLLQGISNEKYFQECKSNKNGIDLCRYRICEKGWFAYNRATTRNGEKISIAYREEETCLVSPSYKCFRIVDEQQLDPKYLLLWFNRSEFDRYARYKSHGSAHEYFEFNEMCDVEIPIPPIEKQRSIVKTYQTITDRITLKRKINKDLVAALSAVYKDLFSDGETQYPKVSLQKICTKIGSGATPKGGKTAYIDEGISLIRSTNVFDFQFEYSDLAHINQTQADALSNVTVEPNDVLFNITGVSVARCCMVPDDVLPARVNQHVMIVRPAKGVAMSYYIMFTLCSAGNKAKLLGIGQSGSTREAINKQELESFEIPIPDDDSLNKFGEIALCAYKNIQCNVKEIRILEDMKSVLLAQLSSH